MYKQIMIYIYIYAFQCKGNIQSLTVDRGNRLSLLIYLYFLLIVVFSFPLPPNWLQKIILPGAEEDKSSIYKITSNENTQMKPWGRKKKRREIETNQVSKFIDFSWFFWGTVLLWDWHFEKCASTGKFMTVGK